MSRTIPKSDSVSRQNQTDKRLSALERQKPTSALDTHGAIFIISAASYSAPAGSPSVTATIGTNGNAAVTISATIETTVGGDSGFVGLSIDGAPAVDVATLGVSSGTITGSATAVINTADFVGPLTPGAHTFALQYRGSAANNVGFTDSFLEVRPY